MKRFRLLFSVLFLLGVASLIARRGVDDRWGEARPGEPAHLALDENRYLGTPVAVANLTVWPVHAGTYREVGDFLAPDEGQAQALVSCRELDEGRVGTLVIENKDRRRPVLIPAGTVFKGGRQDRQVGEDTIVPPATVSRAKAYCIEQRRWSRAREGKDTGGKLLSMRALTAAPVRCAALFGDDQATVWKRVARCNDAGGKNPATRTYVALLDERDAAVLARRGRLAEAVRAHFQALEQPAVGFAYAVNGQPVSVRVFAHPRLFEQQFDGFLRAMCLEADLASRADGSARAAATAAEVVKMVRAINRERESVRTNSAGNRVGIRRGAAGAGGGCYMRRGEDWVPVTEAWTASPSK